MLRALSYRTVLLVVAAPAEAKAAIRALGPANPSLDPEVPVPWTLTPLTPGVDLLVTGIGKANAAGAVGRFLDPGRHSHVLNVGIGGALPSVGGVGLAAKIGSVHVASACVFADEGVRTESSFVDCDGLGFPMGDFRGSDVPTDPAFRDALAEAIGVMGVTSRIATVSTCSGNDTLAQEVAQRTEAAVEAMEGAAIALVCHHLKVPMAEVRVVSNTTGDRARQKWAVREALRVLEGVLGRVFPDAR